MAARDPDRARRCLVIALGVYLLINRRHPRFLARVPPTRLALWSFLAAMAHGAGLMLVPIYLGICATVETDAGHAAASDLMVGNARIALVVAVAHTLAMTVSGGVLAFGVYRWLGLRFLSRSWFNLDLVWALSLILVGALSLIFTH
jgi:cadmium resistance protein CadD (predicted permease)